MTKMPAVLQIPELVLLPLPLWKLKNWIGKALALILLLCFFIMQTEGLDCLTYRAINGNNCHMCQPGYYKEGDCDKNGLPAPCVPCDNGTFQETCNQATKCAPCSEYCHMFNAEIVSKCNRTSDIICQCKEGYFLVSQSGDQQCYRQRYCPTGFGVRKIGTPISDTVCEPCIPGKTFSNVSSSIQQCRNCTVCMTIVISECTPVKDTVCATAAVDKGLENGSHSLAVGLGVGILGLLLCIGLLLFCFCRRRRTSCSHYGGLPTISIQQQSYKVDEEKSMKIFAQVKNANTNTLVLNPILNGYNNFSLDDPSLILAHGSVSSPPITPTVTGHVCNYSMTSACGNQRQSIENGKGMDVGLISQTNIDPYDVLSCPDDIQMDVRPIGDNDLALHNEHMHRVAGHQGASSSGNYHNHANRGDETQPKEIILEAEQTEGAEGGNSCPAYNEPRQSGEVYVEEPAGVPATSTCRIPTETCASSIFIFLTEEIVDNFLPFFRTLVPFSVKPDHEMPNIESWIQEAYRDNNTVREAHYQLLLRWKKYRGRLDDKFCKEIKEALTQSQENETVAKLEQKFSKYFC